MKSIQASLKGKTNYIIGAIALIVVIAVGAVLIGEHRAKSAAVGAKLPSLDENMAANASQALSVENQAAGTSVAVSSVSVSAYSWVAIREADGSRVLGAARVLPGESTATVPLLRATVSGKTYEAVIFTDDGDRAFDLHKDTLLDGVKATFEAQ